MNPKPENQVDVWLIYKSEDDPGQWVAHSLKTDQLAVGDCVISAYTELKQVMRAFWQAAANDPSIVIERAPREFFDRLKDATPLEDAFLARAEELLARRCTTMPNPQGTIFKALDLEPLCRKLVTV
ncbi:MAG: hypothetical protein PHU85_02525 [Phycisphaerae bacterium]|nr:hypothetical protein [Phycisphaerae bacterium]